MTRAEEASIAYQLVAHGPRVMGGDAVLSDDDFKFWNINYDFVAGYEQAQKDLELTWEDIQRIVEIADDILLDPQRPRRLSTTKEVYYTEVLRRYKEEQK